MLHAFCNKGNNIQSANGALLGLRAYNEIISYIYVGGPGG